MLMGVTDTIVAGRANTTDLAALAVGNAIYSPLWFALSGSVLKYLRLFQD